jgi:hypothetical protein
MRGDSSWGWAPDADAGSSCRAASFGLAHAARDSRAGMSRVLMGSEQILKDPS